MTAIFDPYLILQVRRNATREEIKRSYRRLVVRCHPDVCSEPDAADRFRRVVAAYEMIDEEKKSTVRPAHTGRHFQAAAGPRPAPSAQQAQQSARKRFSMKLGRKLDHLSIQELIARFEGSYNRYVRIAAAQALGRRRCLAAVLALSRNVASCTDKEVLLAIIGALGESRIPRAAYTLAPLLGHRDLDVASAAEQAIYALKTEVTVPILERLLRTEPLIIRARMVRTLRRILRFAAA
ncbi:MAG TPA: DnaJ domain-containing protein [bacterium]|nr:DnaJ domain-containing protein [bacterium]HQL61848.1 DnaJ domain-containing protein [bacterium]